MVTSSKQRPLMPPEKTATVHIANVMRKLGAGNRTEAAVLARQLGLGDE
jgi:DNA-binding NarL/FixJ family response regulator